MSLARERYLKRKRELLGNININDSNLAEKKEQNFGERKREAENEENSYKRKSDKENKFFLHKNEYGFRRDENHHEDEERNKQAKRGGPRDNSSISNYNKLNYKKNDRWHRENYTKCDEHSEHVKKEMKEPLYDTHESKKYRMRNKNDHAFNERNNQDDLQRMNTLKENSRRDFSNTSKISQSFHSSNEHMYKEDVDYNMKREKNVNAVMSNISYELLTDLNNIEINDSSVLLIYICKLLLHICGKANENQFMMNTSITSVEILREIKNRNRKSIKLLKINTLNNVLTYMSNNCRGGNQDDINHNELTQEKLDKSLEKHKEIKLEDSCIDIEIVGISIIIKVIYIRNIKNLLTKYLYQQGNNSRHVADGMKTSNDAKLNYMGRDEHKKSTSMHITSQKIVDSQMIGKQIPYEHRSVETADGVSRNMYSSLIQENDKKKKKELHNQNYTMEHESKYGECNPSGDKSGNNDHINNNNNNNGRKKINYLENLLNEPTAKEKKIKQEKTNILSIIEAPTVIEEMRIKKFQKKNDSVKIICPYLTKKVCQKHNKECNKVHFKKIISEHTDVSLGDCSYLDTCRHIETCKFVHYAVDKDDKIVSNQENVTENNVSIFSIKDNTYGPQWIRCDLRNFDLSIFNQYVSVVMADPPWDIHMDLPYGTMTDNEMKLLPVQLIQDEGMIFLWVTGRAMELARECLQIWGYKRVEEILWVKTNHLQRIIRTGRTGHWLNHSKEHCLVGVKGNPIVNRNIDCNVIVSEVRETSRKPDEIYTLIERLCPQNLKIELFGRPHNIRSNWITLGNQLNGVVLHHPQIKERYNKIAPQFNMPLCDG
ncbi:hypothetical protein, conserved [Plasmodium gonderi]|uniref:mRNA (N6-adenosine)-methyltransferase n=1 Tax=Plasmodium gonderi TaxID=77519 RepID=A0A1Y1J9K1_PLAGO|nr:hypothetical protein, conserved [Plasmodium gonderi]GAW79179.1 hypothetical protein, conserved [Plasmodium gonderi]